MTQVLCHVAIFAKVVMGDYVVMMSRESEMDARGSVLGWGGVWPRVNCFLVIFFPLFNIGNGRSKVRSKQFRISAICLKH